MEFEDIKKEPALLEGRIPTEVFYMHFIQHQNVLIDRDLLNQLKIRDFNRFMKDVKVFLNKNRDWAYSFDYLMNDMQKVISESSRLQYVEILRLMVEERDINGNYIRGRFYHCLRRDKF